VVRGGLPRVDDTRGISTSHLSRPSIRSAIKALDGEGFKFVHSFCDTQGETSEMKKNEALLLLVLVALSGASGLAPTPKRGTPFPPARSKSVAASAPAALSSLSGVGGLGGVGEPALHPRSPVPVGPRVLTPPCLPSVALCRAAFMGPAHAGGKLMLRASGGAKSMSAVPMQVDEKKS
jgi:hypothetical protein